MTQPTSGNGYRGMRWFKCDLQVQTPEDGAHWADDDLRLGSPRRPRTNGQHDESHIQDKARQYLRRCHELELDAIGVTDHNFCDAGERRDWFLTHLIVQNRTVAGEAGREPLWIFPGFEVDIGYHVLCLFAPTQRDSSSLEGVDQVLTTLGLPRGSRFDNGRPKPLRRDDAYLSLRMLLNDVQEKQDGMVIAAHAFSNDGLCKDGTHRDDFLLDGLLCVEVNGVPSSGSRERAVLVEPASEWKRRTSQPAYIMSSDAKSLRTGDDGKPIENALGYRHTWIKMSEPSVEALRQAFLDPASRIRLPVDPSQDPSPDDRQQHARVLSLAIEGAKFVDDQSVELSPNLNCIIGGRGTGKSTLLEYIRLCLRREDSEHRAVKDQVARIRGTLPQNATLTLRWRSADGVNDGIEFRSGAQRARILEREVLDPDAVFRQMDVRLFSQKELSEITQTDQHGQAVFLLPLLNQLAVAALKDLDKREAQVREEVRALLASRRKLEQRRKGLETLKQEELELGRQWDARVAVTNEAKQRAFAREAKQFATTAGDDAAEDATRIRSLADEVGAPLPALPESSKSWPRQPWFQQLHSGVNKARAELAAEVRAAADRFEAAVNAVSSGHDDFEKVQTTLRLAEEDFAKACEQQGLEPEDLTRLQSIDDERRAKQGEIEATEREIKELANEVALLESKRGELRQIWHEQYTARTHRAHDVAHGEHVPLVGEGTAQKAFIEVKLRFFAERQHFHELWSALAPDGRTKLGRQWEELADAVMTAFLEETEQTETESHDGDSDTAGPPITLWDVVEGWLDDSSTLPASHRDLTDELVKHLRDTRRQKWEETTICRVPDSADLVLYRQDGTRRDHCVTGDCPMASATQRSWRWCSLTARARSSSTSRKRSSTPTSSITNSSRCCEPSRNAARSSS